MDDMVAEAWSSPVIKEPVINKADPAPNNDTGSSS